MKKIKLQRKPKRHKLEKIPVTQPIEPLEKEIKGNILDYIGKRSIVCVTTNCFVKKNGENVMGAGNAKDFKNAYPDLPFSIGVGLKFGPGPSIVKSIPIVDGRKVKNTYIMTFPTKPDYVVVKKDKTNILPIYRDKCSKGQKVPGYMGYSDLELIRKSADFINFEIQIMEKYKVPWIHGVIIPKPGIENRGLTWKKVKKVLKETGLYDNPIVQFIEKG